MSLPRSSHSVRGEGCAPAAGSSSVAGCCANCGRLFVLAAVGRPRRFCSQRCKQAFYRREAAEFRNGSPFLGGLSLREMLQAVGDSAVRTYGGHLERDGSSVVDACRRSRVIDRRLVCLLGGVPTGRRRGCVVELQLPPVSTSGLVEAA